MNLFHQLSRLQQCFWLVKLNSFILGALAKLFTWFFPNQMNLKAKIWLRIKVRNLILAPPITVQTLIYYQPNSNSNSLHSYSLLNLDSNLHFRNDWLLGVLCIQQFFISMWNGIELPVVCQNQTAIFGSCKGPIFYSYQQLNSSNWIVSGCSILIRWTANDPWTIFKRYSNYEASHSFLSNLFNVAFNFSFFISNC